LWNPLAAGTPAERKDKLLAEWSEPYYKSICERYTQLALATLAQIGEQATLRRVIALLGDPAKLAMLAGRLPAAEQKSRPLSGGLLTGAGGCPAR